MQTSEPRLGPDVQTRQALARVYALLIELAERNGGAASTSRQAVGQINDIPLPEAEIEPTTTQAGGSEKDLRAVPIGWELHQIHRERKLNEAKARLRG